MSDNTQATKISDESLTKVSGGLSKKEVEEKLYKVGDFFDNGSGYFYKIVRIVSIDYSNIDNSEYEIEVYFFRNHYEYNSIRKHGKFANYKKC